MDKLYIYILAFLLFPLIDMVYLNGIAAKMYGDAIQRIQGSPMRLKIGYAVASYLFLCFGMYYFLLRDLDSRKKWFPQIIRAFLFGLVIYGVYETTNAAIIDGWTLDLVLVDTLWGGILYASVIGVLLWIGGA
jgi:uncharacterized membrane protein